MRQSPLAILEIGAGKIDVDKIKDTNFYVFVDRSYDEKFSQKLDLDFTNQIFNFLKCRVSMSPHIFFINKNIFEFMDGFPFKFDKIIANRIFEHMDYIGDMSVGRLLEACHVLLGKEGTLEIIVPNALLLAKKLIQVEKELASKNDKGIHDGIGYSDPLNIDNELLILNTEFMNIRQDPHMSLWTPEMAKKYIEQEGVWKIYDMQDMIPYAGRDIYMKISCELK